MEIFCDDNIDHGLANIVDARDAKTGKPFAFQLSIWNSLNVQQCLVALYLIAALHYGTDKVSGKAALRFCTDCSCSRSAVLPAA